MKIYIFNLLTVLTIICNIQTFKAQSLSPGDLAFIGMNTDTKEGFSFITLTEIPANEKIFFSDRGIIDSEKYITSKEGTYLFTAPIDGVPCGTIISFKEDTPNVYTISGITGATMELIEGIANLGPGDQVYAYQTSNGLKSSVPSDAVFIAGIMSDYDPSCVHTDNSWTKSLCVSSTSESIVPPGLTNGLNCISIIPSNTEFDNMRYIGPLTGEIAVLKTLINNVSNWETNDSSVLDITASGYAIPSIVCSGSTLSNNIYELENTIKVFPNPTRNILNVKGISTKTTYSIYNLLGKKIMSGEINNDVPVNTNDLSIGIYFIKVDNYKPIRFIKK